MATTYNDTQIAVIDSSGNISVIYPRTKASLVSVTEGKYCGSTNTTVLQTALDNIIAVTSNTPVTNFDLLKQGNVVNIQCHGVTGANLISTTIPAGYKPYNDIHFTAVMITGGNTYTALVGISGIKGRVSASYYTPGGSQVHITSAYTSHSFYFTASYIPML